MGVNWAAGLMRWKPHTDRHGKTYSLAHLHPFRFQIHLQAHGREPARTVTINVGFALHVFTCKLDQADGGADRYTDDREVRVFDIGRYNASLRLEMLIRGLERRKCYFAGRENFFTVDLKDAPAGHEYRVFFVVRRLDGSTVELIVQSAYFGNIEERPRGQLSKQVRFIVIVSSALLAKKPKPPP